MMAAVRGRLPVHRVTAALIATLFLPGLLLAGPVDLRLKGDDGSNNKLDVEAGAKKLIRNRRNISWYKQHSDFWNWYKYFSDSGNHDGVAQLDKVYLSYLQNKNRAESRRSHKLYLQHLSDIYKSCAESDDPNCVASYTSRPKPKPKPKPEAPSAPPAPVKACDPYRDPYCLLPSGYYYPYLAPASVKAAAPAPAPVKAPAYLRTPVLRDPRASHLYYSPLVQPFLSADQKAELLRICDAEDVECLQYHLRAAYGYKPAAAVAPSYAHLGCDPKSDPHCVPQLVQKAPSGLYLRYPHCDPRDPYCAYAAALASAQNRDPPSPPPGLERPCNPLYDDSCNPLTATKFASLAPEEPKEHPASEAGAMRAPPGPRHDPYSMFRDASAGADLRRRVPVQPPRHQPEEAQHPLGPRGKTKEGYECFIGYDAECFPLRSQDEPRAGAHRQTHEAYEPHLNADGSRSGVIEPDPDCDPEYDGNCRLRRYEPETTGVASSQPRSEHHQAQVNQNPAENHHREEPDHDQQQYDPYVSGQEDPYAGFGPQEPGTASFQDILRGYGAQFPGQDDHRAYGDYRKK